MTDLEKAIEAIEKQQGKLKKFSMAHTVGEQLKDILRDSPPPPVSYCRTLQTPVWGS